MARLKYYLDTRTQLKDGTYSLSLSLSHQGSASKIYISRSYQRERWEALLAEINLQPRSRWSAEAQDIYYIKVSYDSALARIQREEDIREMTATELRDAVQRIVTGEARSDRRRLAKCRLLARFQKYAEGADTDGTRRIYERTAKKIQEYDPNAERLGLDEVNKEWLEGFDNWLKATTSANIRNMYFRNIRAVMNDAIRDGLTKNYPFDRFKMPKLEPTRKRALSLRQIRQLRDVPCDEYQAEYRDMFLLMVYLIGINAVDLLTLRKSNLVEGRIEYRRTKTHKNYSVKVEPEAMEIIERYRGENWLLSPLDRYASYKDYLAHMNRALKKLGMSCPKNGLKREGEAICSDLSTYWARHTWGTIAAQLDVPLDVIARAMGHSWVENTVTSIYIAYDMRKVDAANRKVIDAIVLL